MPYSLVRISDRAGDSGRMSNCIAWNEDGTFKEIVGDRPQVGCSMQVGSALARTYDAQDWWMTTVITEILEETETKVRFRTENSEYIWEKF